MSREDEVRWAAGVLDAGVRCRVRRHGRGGGVPRLAEVWLEHARAEVVERLAEAVGGTASGAAAAGRKARWQPSEERGLQRCREAAEFMTDPVRVMFLCSLQLMEVLRGAPLAGQEKVLARALLAAFLEAEKKFRAAGGRRPE